MYHPVPMLLKNHTMAAVMIPTVCPPQYQAKDAEPMMWLHVQKTTQYEYVKCNCAMDIKIVPLDQMNTTVLLVGWDLINKWLWCGN